jgi:hypothetical protein
MAQRALHCFEARPHLDHCGFDRWPTAKITVDSFCNLRFVVDQQALQANQAIGTLAPRDKRPRSKRRTLSCEGGV